MAFCTKCGTQFEAGTAFCGNCGAAVAAPGMKAPNISQQAPASSVPEKKTTSLLERFTSSWMIRVLVIVLTLAGVGIHYFYTQHHRRALIDTVRNSHTPEFPNATVGQSLETTFKNYSWTTFKNPDKSITVGFVGYQTFQDALGGPGNPDMPKCAQRDACRPILKKITDACVSSDQSESSFREQVSCVHDGIENSANTLIPVHFLFAANDQDGSVSLIKTDLLPDQTQ